MLQKYQKCLSVGLLKKLKEEETLKADNVENESFKYAELNKAKLRYMLIKEFKDDSAILKTILNEMEKLEMIGEKEINEIQNETKTKLNKLNEEIYRILLNLEFDLCNEKLKRRFFNRPNNYEDEINEIILRKAARNKIDETKRSKEEVKNKEDELLKHDVMNFKSLS